MKLEEALKAMRNGAKIRVKQWEPDISLMACKISLGEITEDLLTSICKMQGNSVHPDMHGNQLSFYDYVDILNAHPHLKEKITFPTINLLDLISDDWEVA